MVARRITVESGAGGAVNLINDPANGKFFKSHLFIDTYGLSSMLPLNSTTTGSGAGVSGYLTTRGTLGRLPGAVIFTTGSTSTGGAGAKVSQYASEFSNTGNKARIGAIFSLPVLPVSGGENFFYAPIAFSNNAGSPPNISLDTTGVSVSLYVSADDANFQLASRNNAGTWTKVDTGIPVVAGTWYNCELEIVGDDAGAGSAVVNLYIAEVGQTPQLVATKTGIPTGGLGIFANYIKKTEGTTARVAYMSSVWYGYDLW